MTNEEIDIINSMRGIVLRSIRFKKTIDVRDVMQDLFVKILSNYKKFSELDAKEDKRKYVYRVCKNLLVDMNRRERTHKRKGPVIGLFFYDLDVDHNQNRNIKPLQISSNTLERIELKEVLKTLHGYTLRQELLLFSEGFLIREIASHKNISINTVLGRIRYARNFLNQNLHGKEN